MSGTCKALFKVKCTRAVVCLLLVVELAPSVWCWCPASYSVGNSLGGHLAPHPSTHLHPHTHPHQRAWEVDGNYSGGFERWALKSRLNAVMGDNRRMNLWRCLDESTCRADLSFEEKPGILWGDFCCNGSNRWCPSVFWLNCFGLYFSNCICF